MAGMTSFHAGKCCSAT